MEKRTVYCGKVSQEYVGSTITLKGWVQKRRDLGSLIFVDLRDREGQCQIIFDAEYIGNQMKVAESLRNEYVISVTGELKERDASQINEKIATGRYELVAHSFDILATSKTPPIYIENELEVQEDLRLRHRFLDLRRPKMFANLKLRHQVTSAIRRYLDGLGFIDVETPYLTKSTPEGARDFLVQFVYGKVSADVRAHFGNVVAGRGGDQRFRAAFDMYVGFRPQWLDCAHPSLYVQSALPRVFADAQVLRAQAEQEAALRVGAVLSVFPAAAHDVH